MDPGEDAGFGFEGKDVVSKPDSDIRGSSSFLGRASSKSERSADSDVTQGKIFVSIFRG